MWSIYLKTSILTRFICEFEYNSNVQLRRRGLNVNLSTSSAPLTYVHLLSTCFTFKSQFLALVALVVSLWSVICYRTLMNIIAHTNCHVTVAFSFNVNFKRFVYATLQIVLHEFIRLHNWFSLLRVCILTVSVHNLNWNIV